MREATLEATFPTTLTHLCHSVFFDDSQFLKKFLSLRTLKDWSVSEWRFEDETEPLKHSTYNEKNDTMEPPVELNRKYTRRVRLVSEIQTPKVIGVNEGSVMATSNLVWHSDSHFTDDMTIDILSDLPMKDSFFFSFKWTAKAVANDVHLRIEIRSSFNKNLPVVSSVIETGMEGYLKKLGKKWIELAADYIDEELEAFDSKHVAKKLPPPPVPPRKTLPPVPKHLLSVGHVAGDETSQPIGEDHSPEIAEPKLIVPTPDESASPVSPSITPTKRKREKVVIVDTSPPSIYEEYFYWIIGIIIFLFTLARERITRVFPEHRKLEFKDVGVNTEPSDQSVQL